MEQYQRKRDFKELEKDIERAKRIGEALSTIKAVISE